MTRSDAIIPIKRLSDAKRRLAPVLDDAERQSLVLQLLAHEIKALRSAGQIRRISVISPDPEVLRRGEQLGALGHLQQAGGLNDAIHLGARDAEANEAESILVLLGDLPFLTGLDIRHMLSALEPGRVVLAPDRRQRGTNALATVLGDEMSFHFGPDSLAAHQVAAEGAGLTVRRVERFGLGFDVDTPADLRDYQQALVGSEE